jgi:cytochrome c biogenesis protein CcdA/thiol-disulfide isomerase/thioredoxin
MFLLFGAFIAGILTVLAPCVLPLLPIIIGGSVTGDAKDKKRPLVIAASLAISLIVFTLLLKATTLLINIPPKSITYFSGVVIILLGIVTLFPSIYATIIGKLGIEQRATKALGKGFQRKDSLLGPIITGAALGPVFSSCSPVYAYILATVLPVNFGQAFAYIIAYVLGLSLVLLAIGYYGQQAIAKVKFAADPKGTFQRVIAILFIIVGVLIFTGYDKKFQTYVSQHTPFNLDGISAKFLPDSKNKINDKELFNIDPVAAPEFTGLGPWINSDPQTLASLKGKVVLVDFWTYSCINCIRNNPYLIKLYNTYKDQGFVVVGIHAPEFSFEKVEANVRKGVKDQHIPYPVALDNDFATWNAFSNRSWPASYLIDAKGQVRRIHEGEGEYDKEEQAVRALLQENGKTVTAKVAENGKVVVPVGAQQTPETYLGTQRASNFASKPALGAAATSTFTAPQSLDKNYWALSGTWDTSSQKITAAGNSKLKFHVSAKDVYLVAGSAIPAAVSVTIDGKPISSTGLAGSDVKNSKVTIGESRLYRIASFPKLSGDHTIELTVPDGVDLNVFTFGS